MSDVHRRCCGVDTDVDTCALLGEDFMQKLSFSSSKQKMISLQIDH